MNEFDKEYLECQQLLLDSYDKISKMRKMLIDDLEDENKELEITIEHIVKYSNENKIEIFGIDEICKIFHWEEQKTRKFLKMSLQMKYASKIGKQIIITKENLEKYLKFLEGKDLTI